MVPVIILSAWFCVLVILSKFDFEAVAQAGIPYSKTGLTFPVYNCFSIWWSAPHVVPASFLIRVIHCLAFFWHFSVWFAHVNLVSIVIPRYVGLFSSGSSCPFSFNVTLCCLVESVKTVYVVFFSLMFSSHFCVHSSSFFNAPCIVRFA